MPRQIITTANAPSSPLYSQGVKAGSHVLVSGITQCHGLEAVRVIQTCRGDGVSAAGSGDGA